MKKALLIYSLLILFSSAGIAQTTPASRKGPHHIGLHAGGSTGVGFSYRYWPGRFGLQVTGIPTFSDNSTFISGGASLLTKFKDNEVVDFFGYLGNHVQYTDYSIFFGETNFRYNIGLGIGLKIDFLEVLNLNLQVGYGIFNVTDKVNTNITGEFGLYYNL